jgi:hypothetical protein
MDPCPLRLREIPDTAAGHDRDFGDAAVERTTAGREFRNHSRVCRAGGGHASDLFGRETRNCLAIRPEHTCGCPGDDEATCPQRGSEMTCQGIGIHVQQLAEVVDADAGDDRDIAEARELEQQRDIGRIGLSNQAQICLLYT